MTTPPPRMWVSFLLKNDYERWRATNREAETRDTFYTVQAIKMIRGSPVSDFAPGDEIVRVCSNLPVTTLSERSNVLSGCTQHLNYTSEAQRSHLTEISLKEIPSSEQPVTVLIPIRKLDAWWNLALNTRFELMNGSKETRGHTAIGEEFASVIFRQLLHARYLDSSKKNYDFLTYFEFKDSEKESFEALLKKLRDTALNSEWQFVDNEQEIWMRKIP